MNKFILDIKHLNVIIEKTEILKNINLNIAENEFLGIIGPNGGGKTTLLKTILGLIKKNSGEILISGDSHLNQLKSIGYVPQFLNFDKNYPIKVIDIVLMGRISSKLFNRFDNYDKEIAIDALEKVDMVSFQNHSLSNLSGGERQRVLIARGLAAQPKLLLLDEPTANIDSKTSSGFYDLLNELNEKMTIILVSHDIGVISNYVKKIACLNKELIYHDSKEITEEMISAAYDCPIDLIAHGLPHRVLHEHKH